MPTNYTPSASTYHSGYVTIPVDGDARTMVTLAPPIEAALDNAAWCEARIVSALRIMAFQSALGSGGSASWATASTATFADVTSPLFSAGISTLVGDIVIVELWGSMQISNGGSIAFSSYLKLQDSQNAGGYADMPGTSTGIGATLGSGAGVANTVVIPIRFAGVRTISTPGTYQVKSQGSTSNGNTGQLVGAIGATMTILRSN